MTQPPMKIGNADDFQTPPIALQPLYPYLKKDWTIWECAEGKGNLTSALIGAGFKVIGSDILNGQDFLNGSLRTFKPKEYDCIVTNPPYSLKEQFLERCYELENPFALLLPLTTFEGIKRQKLFREHGVQVIFFNKRINFETPSGSGSGSWFATAWFTHGLNLPKDFVWFEFPEEEKA